MPLTNPYGKLDASNGATVIAYISHDDKKVLASFADRGVLQLAVTNLLKNLINDIRTLTDGQPTTYRPDSFDIIGILVEPRGITYDQLQRIGGTSIGRSAALGLLVGGPSPLGRPGEGEGVRSKTPTSAAVSSDLQEPARSRKRPVGKEKTKREKKDNGGGKKGSVAGKANAGPSLA